MYVYSLYVQCAAVIICSYPNQTFLLPDSEVYNAMLSCTDSLQTGWMYNYVLCTVQHDTVYKPVVQTVLPISSESRDIKQLNSESPTDLTEFFTKIMINDGDSS